MSRGVFLTFIFLYTFFRCSLCQGEFPTVVNSLQLKPIYSEDGGSLCGRTGAETYCAFSRDPVASFLPNCIESTCDNSCPHGDTLPRSQDLLTSAGLTGEGGSRPGSPNPSTEFTSTTSASASPDGSFQEGFSYSVWFQQTFRSTGTLVSKANDTDRIFAVLANDTTVTFLYKSSSQNGEMEVTTTGLNLPLNVWHHLSVTVHLRDFALFVNGSLVVAYDLEMPIQDADGSISVGTTRNGEGRFIGYMQDALYFLEAITKRDIQGLAGVPVSYVHGLAECRCPPSHPRVNPANGEQCIQYPGGLVPRGSTRRVHEEARPRGNINDGVFDTLWVSEIGNPSATLTINMGSVPYEVLFVLFRFGGPAPKAFVLEKSTDGGNSFVPYQYYADDCMIYFNMTNNGILTTSNAVNCITTGIRQTSLGSITFRPIDPNTRPGTYNTDPELREFLLATHLKFRFIDFFNNTNVGPMHLYYSVLEAITSSRCDCSGHAATCDVSRSSYQCRCVHNTAGRRCRECLPLYNNKPWSRGTTTESYPCRLCQCNNHAVSCHYNSSLDPSPESAMMGGGGVCDSCQDNTAGRYCETCTRLYYRPPRRSPSDEDACEECNCNLSGTTDDGDCVKDDSVPGFIAGQCSCKTNVIGIKCDSCRVGYHNLSSLNQDGCQVCSCAEEGTVGGSLWCEPSTGQCTCKQNVMGLSCEQCRPGFTNLTASNPEGCSPCDCDPTGSVDAVCDQISATCTCKPGVTGDKCNMCVTGYFNFSSEGCQLCDCSVLGSESNMCHTVSGQCPCLPGIGGLNCSECTDGFHNFSQGCISCACNTAGTVNGSANCDKATGQCDCKSKVMGLRCDQCVGGTALLEASNPDGCSPCPCFSPNTNTTAADHLCDQETSQCYCNVGSTGLLCETCVEGYYITSEGCVPCQCLEGTSVDNVCNVNTSQCNCSHVGIGGLTCDTCNPGYYQYPDCNECSCDARGSSNLTCNSTSGHCVCKEFVEGDQCNRCIEGYSFLEASNPSGCSAAPDEQGPPTATLMGSTTVLLQWLPPERPNGAILYYIVYRNDIELANVTETMYTDSDLEPFTQYMYAIGAVNRVGRTTSVSTVVRTSETPPEGVGTPNVTTLNATALGVSWQTPSEPNGVIISYALYIVYRGGVELDSPYSAFMGAGDQFSTVVSGLRPFTEYGLALQACTSGGCSNSTVGFGTTEEASPTFQPPPNITALSSTSVLVTWYTPPEPNGIITEFVIFQRDSPFDSNGVSIQNVSGSAPELLVVVNELSAFTEYEFAVQSHTSAGGTTSAWVRTRTGEDAPSDVQPPMVRSLSPTSLQINWTAPLTSNGVITSYTMYMVHPLQQRVVESSAVDSYVLEGLQAFTEYRFLLEACTSAGCTNSSVVSEVTMDDVPSGQGEASVTAITSEGVAISWDPPTSPNGVIQDYTIQRRLASLTSSEQVYENGVTFAGTTYAQLTMMTVASFTTSVSLWFKTYDAEGTLLHGTTSSGTDYLTIGLREGRPFFEYNCGSGSVSIHPNTTLTFSDGSWHYVEVSRSGRNGVISVNNQYNGTDTSPGTDQILGAFPSLFIGSRPDQSQTDSVTFAGSLRRVMYEGVMLDVSSRDEITEPPLSIVTGGSPVDIENAVHFLGGSWVATDSVFLQPSPISSFGLTVEFRTTDDNGVMISARGDSDTLEVRVHDGILVVSVLWNSSLITSASSRSVCNGEWMTITIVMGSGLIRTLVTDSEGSLDLLQPDLAVPSILLNRNTYFGVADGRRSLGMALRRMEYNGEEVNLRGFWLSSRLVNFAWSPMGGNLSECNSEMEMYTTSETRLFDNNTDPFRTYLYRVGSRNNAGVSYGPWIGVRTLEGAPEDLMTVEVVASDSTSIMVTWTPPTRPNGIILSYTIEASPVEPTWGEPSQLTTNDSVTVHLTDLSGALSAVLRPLEPATTYSVTLSANTSGGSSRGPPAVASTDEGVPFGVQTPQLLSFTAFQLTLTWDLPDRPNGEIVRYEVYVDGVLRSARVQTRQIISFLDPFTNYTIFVRACTRVGCADSNSVIYSTPPDIPNGQAPPQLTVLGSRSIEARWQPPTMPNGVIIEYKLLRLSGQELGTVTELYSGLDLFFVVTGLEPATEYFFAVESHNAGGSARSQIAIGRTREDVPDGIDPPALVDSNSTALDLMWTAPNQTNGIITRYILLIEMENLTEIFNGNAMMYTVTDLEPFTAYMFILQACTRCEMCCGSSETVTYSTMEAPPTGVSPPTVLVVTPTSISFEIQEVSAPNGIVTYTVYARGAFVDEMGNETENSTLVTETQIVYQDSEVGMGISTSLVPFSHYELYLVVSNSAGQVMSSSVFVVTSESSPMGQGTPNIHLLNATTARVSWSPPEQPNGNITHYTLTLTSRGEEVVRVTHSTEGELTTTISNLMPFTTYSVTITAYNDVGTATSEPVHFTTGEVAPEDLDTPVLVDRTSTSLTIMWDPPGFPNGVLLSYQVSVNGTYEEDFLPPDSTTLTIGELLPFTMYSLFVTVCNSAGCLDSASITVTTLESLAGGIQPPTLQTGTSGEVLLSWQPPLQPNGVVLLYHVERSTALDSPPLRIRNTTTMTFADTAVQPFTQYFYRIVVVNGGGEATGPYANITTPEASPSFIDPPDVYTLSSTSLLINWQPPSVPNGVITEYVLKRMIGRQGANVRIVATLNSTVFEYTDEGLLPYTNYSYTVTACNAGGCAESEAGEGTTEEALVAGVTQLAGSAVSFSSIVLSWDSPSEPNGVILQYLLYRESSGDNSSNSELIFQGLDTSYTDVGLLPYTFYTYRYEVENGAGIVSSDITSPIRTLPAPPLVGPALTAEARNSTTVSAQWIPPDMDIIRGPILYYILTATPLGSPPEPISVNLTSTSHVLTGLQPGTAYVITVSLYNGAGSAVSNNVTVETAEGIPAGVQAPTVDVLSPTTVNITWFLPLYPNGDITAYRVNVNSGSVHNATSVGTFTLAGLTPFTTYTIQLEACTQFGCGISPLDTFTTPEAAPLGLATPTLIITGSSSAIVSWMPPVYPNGNITEYQVYRRRSVSCSEAEDTCSYVECPLSHSQCGSQCYLSTEQACCSGVLYDTIEGYTCCDRNYVEVNSSITQVCCGGRLHTAQSNHQCCGEQYLHVPVGSICCETGSGNPQIGMGTACCGGSPYVASADVVCCGGTIETNHVTRTCCGGQMVSISTTTCCEGISHALQPGYSCCGQQYISPAVSLCCMLDDGNTRVHTYGSVDEKMAAREQCCDGELIPDNESCCNGLGYNMSVSVCADRPTTGTMSEQCGTGATCPLSQMSSSFCNRCDFDTETTVCGVYSPRPLSEGSEVPEEEVCSETVLVYTGLALEYTDTGLLPYTEYSYQVVAINSAGNISSGFVTDTTEQAAPSAVGPPLLAVQSSSSIFVHWTLPSVLNGMVATITLYRNNTDIVISNAALSYLDQNLTAFTVYQYQLEVCTEGGCTRSPSSTATTSPATPEGLADPTVAINDNLLSVSVSWSPPNRPNGVISTYTLHESSRLGMVFSGSALQTTVGDLLPYTNYTFVLTACNMVGCVSSNSVNIQTPEIPPTGVDPPAINILSSRSIDISWTPPTSPNGVVLGYILRRDDAVIFNDTALMYRDFNLTPNTQYFYTVEAYNGGGGTESVRVIVHTPQDSPEGLLPPQLQVLSSTSIRATWSPPSQPNGDIISYSVIINNFETEVGLVFEHNATDLFPYTQYRFRVESCTASGCSRSTEVTAQTLEEPPAGVSVPMLRLLGPTAVEVSWQPPTSPNGLITSYEVTRLSGTSPIPSLQHFGSQTVLAFNNTGLAPFTTYQYRLRATNGAGNTFSPYSTIQTPEDVPTGLEDPVVTAITARSAQVTWEEPLSPNGVLLRYDVYVRLTVDPVTLGPGTPQRLAMTNSTVTSVQISTLVPATNYEVMIAAVNGAGQGESAWVSFETAEAAPDDLQPIRVTATPPTGTALGLAWDPPLLPNGVITEYVVYVGSVEMYRGSSTSVTIMRLQPFTTYTLQLEACTLAGCTRGETQSATTAEVAPSGQQPPTVAVFSSTVVSIEWQPPLIPNGEISRYEVLRRRPAVTNSEGSTPASNITVVYTNTDTTVLAFNDTNLVPFTLYEYAVRAINSAGSTQSVFVQVSTDSAAPVGVRAPTLTVVSSSSILVQWTEPSQPHGIITRYEVVRNNSVRIQALSLSYTDTSLDSFMTYSYTIEVCTVAGCTEGPPSVATTAEAIPTGLSPPLSTPLTSQSITVAWGAPTAPNGILTSFRITVQPDSIQVTHTNLDNLIVTIEGLSPYTDYTVLLAACNSAGCSDAVSTMVTTLEDVPQLLSQPQLTVLSSSSVQATWQVPALPNGVIRRYELRRNETLVYSGELLSHIDRLLAPNTVYSYDVQAYTTAGGSERSGPTSIQTNQDTPTGISPPILTPLSSTSIRATWSVPQMPNGVITEYRLILDDREVFRGQGFQYEVSGLLPYTLHEFYLTVCTTTCGSSVRVSSRTFEAAPANMQPPVLTALANVSVLVAWSPPLAPNGIITSYRVERTSPPTDVIASVFSGDALMYLDSGPGLQPATEYQYFVTAVNGVGEVTSDFTTVTTSEAEPVGVQAPQVAATSARSLTLVIRSPTSPNGVITMYRVFRDDVLLSEVVADPNVEPTLYSVQSLEPFTSYAFYVEACNSAGCAQGPVGTFTTSESQPSSLDPPTPYVGGARRIYVNWTQPAQPNGEITRYTLWYRLSCPQPPQITIFPSSCNVGDLMVAFSGNPLESLSYLFISSLDSPSHPLPYTSYEFLLQADNSVGGVNSTFSQSVSTDPSAPELIGGLSVEVVGTSVFVDWSRTFRLNGRLMAYVLTRNGNILAMDLNTNRTLSNEPRGSSLFYTVTVRTSSGNVTSSPVTVIIPGGEDPSSTTSSITPSPSPSSPVPTTVSTPLEPGIIVVIVIASCAVCIIFTCLVVIFIMWLLSKNSKKKASGRTSAFAHQRLNESEMMEFYPVPYKTQEDQRYSGSWTDQEDHYEVHRNKVYASYSPPDAEKKYFRDFNVRDSYGTQISNYTNPKALYQTKEEEIEEFYEDGEPVACTFTDTRI